MMEVKFPHNDDSLVSDSIGFYERARMQVFGIGAGWVVEDELERLSSAGAVDSETRVFQIACAVCHKALRRAITDTEIAMSVLPEDELLQTFIQNVYDGFSAEVPCHHFDQFITYEKGIDSGSPYSLKIKEAIDTHARLLEVGK